MRISDWSSDVCSSDLRQLDAIDVNRFTGLGFDLAIFRGLWWQITVGVDVVDLQGERDCLRREVLDRDIAFDLRLVERDRQTLQLGTAERAIELRLEAGRGQCFRVRGIQLHAECFEQLADRKSTRLNYSH